MIVNSSRGVLVTPFNYQGIFYSVMVVERHMPNSVDFREMDNFSLLS